MPKHDGSLGLKKMHDFNSALVMKLGWGLISDPTVLRAHDLRAKYDYGVDLMLIILKRYKKSHVWKVLEILGRICKKGPDGELVMVSPLDSGVRDNFFWEPFLRM
ncbi:unnamed protein product [Lupinus luteus]|uniref:Uncharacterized protein n=1 Tax=Lupinus luteus TaxID=3873 RepID=A0AAV1VX62_LUPLU